MTLYELVGQEFGIIVYPDGTVAVCNWAGLADATTPVFGPMAMMIGFPCPELECEDEDAEDALRDALYAGEVDDVRTLLPGSYYLDEDTDEPCITTDMDVIYDANYDLPALWGYEVCDEAGMPMSTVNRDEAGNLLPTSATYYKINGTTIIAPHNWY